MWNISITAKTSVEQRYSKAFPFESGFGGAYWHKHVSKLPSLSADERGQVRCLWRQQGNRWGGGCSEADGVSALPLLELTRNPSRLCILREKTPLLLSPWAWSPLYISSRPLSPPHHAASRIPTQMPINAHLRDRPRHSWGGGWGGKRKMA